MRTLEDRVTRLIEQIGPREAFRRLIAENNAWSLGPSLDDGRSMANARTAIYTALVAHWAAALHQARRYARPFAVVALGGTGRGEMAPFSDTDFALLFDDTLEGNRFLMELQRQVLHSTEFEAGYGFRWRPYPFALDDLPRLAEKQLNSFIDMRPVYDPENLAAAFRERIRDTYDPFEHFLHVRGFWKSQWEKAAGEWERLDRLDIKTDAMRVFLAGIWTLAGKRFESSLDIYRQLEDRRDLEAYDLLLRLRAFIHARITTPRPPLGDGLHGEDVLGFDEIAAFGEMLGPEATEEKRFEFANEVRARLLSARRRVARFTRGVIERELREGRHVHPRSPIIYGAGGLYHAESRHRADPREKSRVALSLLVASQRYGVPVDPAEIQTTFRDAGDWLTPVPELSELFYEDHGSLADTFQFLSQFDGAEDRLFPGYARFEVSLDTRILKERASFRGALERQKTRILEGYVRDGRAQLAAAVSPENLVDPTVSLSIPVEAALLDADHLAAVKLALKTKRLPVTEEDLRAAENPEMPLTDRRSSGLSGIPLAHYYRRYEGCCEFSEETLQTAEFLVANRRAFKEWAGHGLNDAGLVEDLVRLCRDEQRLRSLFVFTCADRAEWEGEKDEPARWFNIRELYAKAMRGFRPRQDATRCLEAAGYTREELAILKDFGEDFFTGVYRRYANQFGSHLLRLAEQPTDTGPKVSLLRDGACRILGVAARDFRGLAACITGALWHQGLGLRQAHLFSAMMHGLALDFFHLIPGLPPPGPAVLRAVEESIARQLHIHERDEATLPHIPGTTTLAEWRPGLYCLRQETAPDVGGLVYALAYKVFRHLQGNIFGLVAHAVKGRAYISVYHSLPKDLGLAQARTIVAERFR